MLGISDTVTPVYQLRRDTEQVRKVQKATLNTEQYGIEQTHGLFGSDEWWQKIESGDLPTQRLRGTISRVYMGSMGDWPCFEMSTDTGAVLNWTRFAHTRELSDLYAVGKRVEVDFVIQRNRQRAPVYAGEKTECVIEVRIGDDA